MSPDADRPRRRRKPEPSAEQTFADLLNSFSLDSGRRKSRKDAPKTPTPTPVRLPVQPTRGSAVEPDYFGEAAAIVRAYSWNGGRTTSDVHLEIETLVTACEPDGHAAAVLKAEYQAVAVLCARPRSVAEVAALMRIPLGVARVLLGDMAECGLVDVHRTVSGDGGQSGLDLMERVLSGLRKL